MKSQNLLMAWWFKKITKDVLKKYDYHEYGGALLLGVNGVSVICHGSSKARTIKNAILACKKYADPEPSKMQFLPVKNTLTNTLMKRLSNAFHKQR
ncbi:MAG: hypothetical protein ACYSTR_02195 [Planctomycetota bacterium]|jgi:fatty acid/phospholipid biosynthesis enzyme